MKKFTVTDTKCPTCGGETNYAALDWDMHDLEVVPGGFAFKMWHGHDGTDPAIPQVIVCHEECPSFYGYFERRVGSWGPFQGWQPDRRLSGLEELEFMIKVARLEKNLPATRTVTPVEVGPLTETYTNARGETHTRVLRVSYNEED